MSRWTYDDDSYEVQIRSDRRFVHTSLPLWTEGGPKPLATPRFLDLPPALDAREYRD